MRQFSWVWYRFAGLWEKGRPQFGIGQTRASEIASRRLHQRSSLMAFIMRSIAASGL